MDHRTDPVITFYLGHLHNAELKGNILNAECPFCKQQNKNSRKTLVVFVNPESYFYGYYCCLNRCTPGGFPLYFARQLHIELSFVPGFDPDRDYAAVQVNYPVKNINHECVL